jgi:L-ascorbate metabolism protein UlaG (beta-lactamase superfamily)
MQLTWLDSNSWAIFLEGKNILLDPWLVGDLMFGNTPWLFRGQKNRERELPSSIDVILLSQGLPDHAHIPTLTALDRSIPVIASPRAAEVVRGLGYENVMAIAPGESVTWGGIDFQAVPGSPVGPGAIENGYILRAKGGSLYYEPHGYHDPGLAQQPPVDVVITPTIDLKLPLLGAVIRGQRGSVEVCKTLQARYLLPTAAGGDITFSGLLMKVLQAAGDSDTVRSGLGAAGLSTTLVEVEPWQPWSMEECAQAF